MNGIVSKISNHLVGNIDLDTAKTTDEIFLALEPFGEVSVYFMNSKYNKGYRSRIEMNSVTFVEVKIKGTGLTIHGAISDLKANVIRTLKGDFND